MLKESVWSSYQYYAGWKAVPGWLTVEEVLAGADKKRLKGQRKAYRNYVESVFGEEVKDSPLERAAAGFLLGSAEWVDRMRRLLSGDRKEQKAFRKLETRPDWDKVRKAVEKVKGEEWESFCERKGDWGRDMALYIARHRGGMKLRELGAAAGIENYYAVAQAVKRMNRRVKDDGKMMAILEDVLKCTKIQT